MENKGLQIVIDMTKTMCDCFEHIDVDKQTILKIFRKQKVDIDRTDYRVIYQFGCEIARNFLNNNPFDFDEILKIHQNIGYELVLDYGKFAKSNRYVGSFDNKVIQVPPANQDYKEVEFDNLIFDLNKSNINKIDLILNQFIHQIIEQWFNDGNKRTSYITCNKLLFDYCCKQQNNLLINLDEELFTDLLARFYLEECKEGHNSQAKNDLLMYLKQCIKSNNQSIDVKDFDELKQIFDFNSKLTKEELWLLTEPQ